MDGYSPERRMLMPNFNQKKTTLFYFIMLLSAVFLTLVFLETSLRIAATFVSPRLVSLSPNETKHVILSLGDSNTYGVFYSQDKAYPARLHKILERRAPGRYHVLNLGLPGMNSSQVASHLPEWIDRYRPQSVVISVGLNNYWNRTGHQEQKLAGSSARWLYRLRLYRLYRLIRQRFETHSSLPNNTGRAKLQRTLLKDGADGVEHRNAKTGELLITHQGDIRDWSLPHVEAVDMLRKDLMKIVESQKNTK